MSDILSSIIQEQENMINMIPIQDADNEDLPEKALKRLKKSKDYNQTIINKAKKNEVLAPKIKATDLYFENEAEEGSENEEHDDVVRKIVNEHEESDNPDENVEGLIASSDSEDNDPAETENLKSKFYKDMLKRDYEEIKQVIKGPKIKKRYRDIEQEDEDYISIEQRKNFNKSNDITDMDFFASRSLLIRANSNLGKEEHSDDFDNEELNFMIQSQETSKIKKFTENKQDNKAIIERIKENEKILEDVIFLNGFEDCNSMPVNNNYKSKFLSNNDNVLKKSSSTNIGDFNQLNQFQQRGGLLSSQMSSQNSNNNSMHLLLAKQNSKDSLFSNKSNSFKFGSFGSGINFKNSFLHALKNDKTLKSTKMDQEIKPDNAAEEVKSERVVSIFSANVNRMKPNLNLSALFSKANSQKMKQMNDSRSVNKINDRDLRNKILGSDVKN